MCARLVALLFFAGSVSPNQLSSMELPPLLQRLMSQPGSSMLEDIERHGYGKRAPAQEVVVTSGAGAVPAGSSPKSVPKMASPPKTVSAMWSTQSHETEPDSPNTAIKRSLNMTLPTSSASHQQQHHRGTNMTSSSRGADDTRSTAPRTGSRSNHSSSLHISDVISPLAPFSDPAAVSAGSSAPQTSTPTDVHAVAAKLRDLAMSNDSVASRSQSSSMFERSNSLSDYQTTTGASGGGGASSGARQQQQRPKLKLAQPPAAGGGGGDLEMKPELVTPQALIEKSALALFNKPSSSYPTTQVRE